MDLFAKNTGIYEIQGIYILCNRFESDNGMHKLPSLGNFNGRDYGCSKVEALESTWKCIYEQTIKQL